MVADPFCHEAFATLVDGHMLTSAEESALVASIVFPPGARWLELMYRMRCKKYDQEGEVEGRLAELEAPHGEARGVGGCGLAGNADVLSCRADWHFHRCAIHPPASSGRPRWATFQRYLVHGHPPAPLFAAAVTLQGLL